MLYKCQHCGKAKSFEFDHTWTTCPWCTGTMYQLTLEQVLAEAKAPPPPEEEEEQDVAP